MDKGRCIHLISGSFEPDQAKDILLNQINQQINYYALRSFSFQERFGIQDASDDAHIKKLLQARDDIADQIHLASFLGGFIQVESCMQIGILPPDSNKPT